MSTSKKPVTSKKVKKTSDSDNDAKFQAAVDIIMKIGDFVKVDVTGCTFHPNENVLEKIFSQVLKKSKHVPLYSNNKTMAIVGGRFLYAAISHEVELAPNFNMSGCALWVHDWDDTPRCYHGTKMLMRDNVLEMPPTSEAGMSALKDGRGILCANKWGKQVVKIVQENSMICPEDNMQQRFGQNSNNSCGMSFSDGKKAQIALRNSIEFTSAIFPKTDMKHCLLIVENCECNYANRAILGRQIAKMIPFALTGVDNVSVEDLDPVKSVAVHYPAVFVYQCCNFSGGKRGGNVKSCEFKISFPDVIQAMILARNLWYDVFKKQMPISFPHFKWDPAKQVKNAVLPSAEVCMDECPFGDIPIAKKRKVVEVISDEDDDEEDED
ncbi:DNA-binding protein [Barthadenovirus sternae]|nr:DBP [Tern adenovirus]UJZ92514.1 DNA-binding protein [Tern atadenovirus 1]